LDGDKLGTADVVEAALANALEAASKAGQWTSVEALARELAARRQARTSGNVVDMVEERAKRARSDR